MNIVCPTCHQEHALYYSVQSDGQRTLNYLCNRQEKWEYTDTEDKDGKRIKAMKHVTKQMIAAPFRDGLDIPVHWTPTHARRQNEKQQIDLIANDERRTTPKHGQGGFRD